MDRYSVIKALLEQVTARWEECGKTLVPLSQELAQIGLASDLQERQYEIERIQRDHDFQRSQWELLSEQRLFLISLMARP